MGKIVMIAYQPKPEKESVLMALINDLVPCLREKGLATDRPPMLLRSGKGVLVQIFEWKSEAAIESAHRDPHLQHLWKEFAQTCSYIPLSSVKEAQHAFSLFKAVA